MIRSNDLNGDIIKEFQNSNINLRLCSDSIDYIKTGKYSDIEILTYLLDSLDCYFVGDHFCLSNYDMGCMLYNVYSDKCYILAFSDIDKKLIEGKTLKLYPFSPSEDDRQRIESEY